MSNDEKAPQAVPAPADHPECERCGMTPAQHTPMHWCDNQSFRLADGAVQLGVAPQAVPAPGWQQAGALLTDSPTPRDEWPDEAAYALGHLTGIAFGHAPSDEIGHCVRLVSEALDAAEAIKQALQAVPAGGEPFGRVAVYLTTAPNHVPRYEFYPWPQPPYLDNASECHTVFKAAPPQALQPLTQAAAAVLAERRRQIDAEGWTPEHDDEHTANELSDAAACYALGREAADVGDVPDCWPQSWDESWWRPSLDRRRNLVKAGALILAEIERLDRAAGITGAEA